MTGSVVCESPAGLGSNADDVYRSQNGGFANAATVTPDV